MFWLKISSNSRHSSINVSVLMVVSRAGFALLISPFSSVRVSSNSVGTPTIDTIRPPRVAWDHQVMPVDHTHGIGHPIRCSNSNHSLSTLPISRPRRTTCIRCRITMPPWEVWGTVCGVLSHLRRLKPTRTLLPWAMVIHRHHSQPSDKRLPGKFPTVAHLTNIQSKSKKIHILRISAIGST